VWKAATDAAKAGVDCTRAFGGDVLSGACKDKVDELMNLLQEAVKDVMSWDVAGLQELGKRLFTIVQELKTACQTG